MSGEITSIFHEIFTRGWNQLSDRLSGPMHLRLIVTPTVALILAIKDGWKAAKEKQSAFQLTWKPVKKVILVAMILDFVYQIYVLRAYLIIQSLILVTVLALIPYVLIRGFTTWVMNVINKK